MMRVALLTVFAASWVALADAGETFLDLPDARPLSPVEERCLKRVRADEVGDVADVRQAYRDETDLLDRCALAAVLAKAKDADALALLRRTLRTGREGELFRPDRRLQAREAAAFWLGELRHADATPDLLRLSEVSPRYVSEHALVKIGEPALPHLRRYLSPDLSWSRFSSWSVFLADKLPQLDELAPELTLFAIREDTRSLTLGVLSQHRSARDRVISRLKARVIELPKSADRDRAIVALWTVKAFHASGVPAPPGRWSATRSSGLASSTPTTPFGERSTTSPRCHTTRAKQRGGD